MKPLGAPDYFDKKCYLQSQIKYPKMPADERGVAPERVPDCSKRPKSAVTIRLKTVLGILRILLNPEDYSYNFKRSPQAPSAFRHLVSPFKSSHAPSNLVSLCRVEQP